jgi:hypothetical protein
MIERNNFKSNVMVVKIHHKYEKQQKLQNINKKKKIIKKIQCSARKCNIKKKEEKVEKDLKLSKLPSC